jgi:hypothetical protein
MDFVFAPAIVPESVKSTLDRHWREAVEIDVAEIPDGIGARVLDKQACKFNRLAMWSDERIGLTG